VPHTKFGLGGVDGAVPKTFSDLYWKLDEKTDGEYLDALATADEALVRAAIREACG